MVSEFYMLVLEIIGTVSFAVSGAFAAIKARFDIFGVIFVGTMTAFGGGIVRDVLIGKYPPSVFLKFHIFILAVLASAAVFVITYINSSNFDTVREQIERINNFFDAVGLAAFSVMGTEAAFAAGFSDYAFFSVALGMMTGIGGGIFRDILTDTTPHVLKKRIYAVASIMGGLIYYVLRKYCGLLIIASIAAMVPVVALRMLATKFCWSLPKIIFEEEKSDCK